MFRVRGVKFLLPGARQAEALAALKRFDNDSFEDWNWKEPDFSKALKLTTTVQDFLVGLGWTVRSTPSKDTDGLFDITFVDFLPAFEDDDSDRYYQMETEKCFGRLGPFVAKGSYIEYSIGEKFRNTVDYYRWSFTGTEMIDEQQYPDWAELN